MKKCPKCGTVYLDNSNTCSRCMEPLADINFETEEQNQKQTKTVIPSLLYTFGFMLFIAIIYFLASLFIN